MTHLRRRFQTATSSARQYSISRQTVLRRLRQARQSIRPRRPNVGQVLTARHWAARFSIGGASSGLGLYSLMSLVLTLVIMMVEFEFLEEEGERFADNCLIERDRLLFLSFKGMGLQH